MVDAYCIFSGSRVNLDRAEKGCARYRPLREAYSKTCSVCVFVRPLLYDGSVNPRHLAERERFAVPTFPSDILAFGGGSE